MRGMRYQPQGRALINAAHPLARGLVGFWIPNGGRFRSALPAAPDAVLTSAGRIVPGPKGLRIATTGGASAVIPNTPQVKPSAAITVLVDGAMPNNGYPLGCENGNDGWGAYPLNGFIRTYLRVGSAWADQASTAATGVAAAQLGFTFDGATFWSVSNGKRVSSQAIAGSITNSPVGIAINAMNPANANPGNGALHYVALWDRALSPDELRQFHATPWQMFADPDEDDYATAAALNSYTLSVTPTTVLLGGGEVAMRTSRRVSMQPATLAAVGGEVSLRAARKLVAQPAALELSAGVAALKAARRVSVIAAGLVLQPGDARLRTARRLTAAPAAMSIIDGVIQFQYALAPEVGSYVMQIASAALSLAGGSVGMRVSRRIAVSSCEFVMAARSVRLIAARRQLVSPAHLLLTGEGVALRFSAESPPLDVAKVHPSRIVIFEGSGSRVVVFEGSGSKVVLFEGSGKRMRFDDMSAKVPTKIGDKWTTDRDRDEISFYAADITEELADRNTTVDSDAVTALTFGVELLEGPQVQLATVGGIERTFVVVKLGGVDGELPADWRWVARVPCANGERFDKTTWFNKVDP